MTNTKKSSKVIELPMLGSLNKVTDYIPCLNLVGAVGYNQAAYDEAAKLVKQPLKYLRQTLCLDECAIVWTGDRCLRVYTRRLVAILDSTDYFIYNMYETHFKFVNGGNV